MEEITETQPSDESKAAEKLLIALSHGGHIKLYEHLPATWTKEVVLTNEKWWDELHAAPLTREQIFYVACCLSEGEKGTCIPEWQLRLWEIKTLVHCGVKYEFAIYERPPFRWWQFPDIMLYLKRAEP